MMLALAACGADPQDDLDGAALRLDLDGIAPEAEIVRITVIDEAAHRRDLAPAPSGALLTVYVLTLSPGRFAAHVETRGAQGRLLQCHRVDRVYAGQQVPIAMALGDESEGPCATVAGCLGARDLTEVCNSEDDDCDGTVDEGLGEFTAGIGACACSVPACVGGATQSCTPMEPTAERCNGRDDDCDGVLPPGERDADGDGVMACAPCADDAIRRCGDCDDANPLRAPGRLEVCDGMDNDCNGFADDGITCP